MPLAPLARKAGRQRENAVQPILEPWNNQKCLCLLNGLKWFKPCFSLKLHHSLNRSSDSCFYPSIYSFIINPQPLSPSMYEYINKAQCIHAHLLLSARLSKQRTFALRGGSNGSSFPELNQLPFLQRGCAVFEGLLGLDSLTISTRLLHLLGSGPVEHSVLAVNGM